MTMDSLVIGAAPAELRLAALLERDGRGYLADLPAVHHQPLALFIKGVLADVD